MDREIIIVLRGNFVLFSSQTLVLQKEKRLTKLSQSVTNQNIILATKPLKSTVILLKVELLSYFV